ncbi:hypothetical protein IKG45_00980, partial [Candidatus Saccharibacteria bacterium]|nr:hypothetical protein [Candidatus Saccharibacteria bacterium]
GNIYGTEFRTRLLSVDKNTFTGTVTPPGSGAYTEATVTNPPENLDNNQTNDRPVDAVDKKYDDTIFAGSDNNDSIKATYNHAATAKADENTTSKGCEAMDDYDIPWYIDGDLRKSGVDISTIPFRLAVNNQECINPKDPLLTSEGESYTYTIDNTADEHSSGNAIALGTKDREFLQGGHIASKYELQADKSLKETGELKANVKFKVSRPWNYNLSIKKFAINQPGGLFVTDGSVTLSAEVINRANSEESNPSYSPKDTKAEIYKILVEDTNQRNYYNGVLGSGNGIPGAESAGFIDLNDDKGNGIKYAQKKATGEEPGSSGVKTSDSIDYSYGDDKVGQLLCFYLRVNHTDSNKDTNNNGGYVNGSNGGTPNNNYLYSKLACATLIGVPHAEFWGGSVFSTGNIETKIYQHTRLGGGSTFIIGSWADYGVIGKNNIRGLASGKTIGQEKVDDSYDCKHHPLTINNKTCEDKGTPSVDETYLDATDPAGTAISTIGHNQSIVSTNTKTRLLSKYRKVNGIEDHGLSSIQPTTANAHGQDSQYYCYTNGDFTTLVNCNTTTYGDTNNAYRYTYQDGDLDIGNLTLQHSTTHVIYATRDININGNIKYDTYEGSGYTKLSQIPQYIIIADGNINIDDSVTEINAWLIADADNNGSGTIDTCTFNQPSAEDSGKELIKGPNDYNANVCNDQLVVKGPVFANKLQLSRTQFGAAEKFDINPLSYYWAYAQAKESGRSTTVYLHPLAPRY